MSRDNNGCAFFAGVQRIVLEGVSSSVEFPATPKSQALFLLLLFEWMPRLGGPESTLLAHPHQYGLFRTYIVEEACKGIGLRTN